MWGTNWEYYIFEGPIGDKRDLSGTEIGILSSINSNKLEPITSVLRTPLHASIKIKCFIKNSIEISIPNVTDKEIFIIYIYIY